jgi:hypothetical protein
LLRGPVPLIVLTVLALALLAAVVATDAALKGAGYSIVSLQLAATAPAAQRIVDAWRAAMVVDAAWLNLKIDFAFLLVYPPALALACRSLARRLAAHNPLGNGLGYAVLACTPLDALENLGLMHMLRHDASGPVAALTTACALPKFALVAAAILYGISALLALGRRSWR